VTFNVTPVNDASGNPIPMLSTQRRGEIIQQLRPANGPTDVDGDTLSIASVHRGRHREFASGNVVFTPTANFSRQPASPTPSSTARVALDGHRQPGGQPGQRRTGGQP
jgi:hypothetical protein